VAGPERDTEAEVPWRPASMRSRHTTGSGGHVAWPNTSPQVRRGLEVTMMLARCVAGRHPRARQQDHMGQLSGAQRHQR
jgi:hypothetical protein